MADWLNVVSDYGADNTGAADATADISKALEAAKASFGGIQSSAVVYLPPGVYLISAPLLVPPGVTLLGATPMNQPGDGQTQDWGSVIKPAPSGPACVWTAGANVNGAVSLDATSLTAVSKAAVENVWIDGSGIGAFTNPTTPVIDGIGATAAVAALSIRSVGVYAMTGNGIAGYSQGQAGPDGWMIENSFIQSCAGTGVLFTGGDTHMNNVHAQGCGSGFSITGGNNRLVGCRADQSTSGSGFTVDVRQGGPFSGSTTLIGCGTQDNDQNGLNVINSSTGETAMSDPVIACACSFDGDGANGGNGGGVYAGISVAGANVVTLIGCNVNVRKVAVAGGSPEFALSFENNGYSDPNLIQAIGGWWTSVSQSLINGSDSSTVLSYGVHGHANGQFLYDGMVSVFESSPL